MANDVSLLVVDVSEGLEEHLKEHECGYFLDCDSFRGSLEKALNIMHDARPVHPT